VAPENSDNTRRRLRQQKSNQCVFVNCRSCIFNQPPLPARR